VREALSILALGAEIYPCPKGGRRYRPQVLARGGRELFPYLVDPNTGDPTAFLGGVLFGSGDADVGDDLFPLLQLPFAGGTGFSGNLGEGSYSIFVQQTGPVTEAELGIVVIPAPASAAVLGLAGLAAARRRR